MLMKMFFAKYDLLMELSPVGFFQILRKSNDPEYLTQNFALGLVPWHSF